MYSFHWVADRFLRGSKGLNKVKNVSHVNSQRLLDKPPMVRPREPNKLRKALEIHMVGGCWGRKNERKKRLYDNRKPLEKVGHGMNSGV